MLPVDYELIEKAVSVGDFMRLRRVSGLSERPQESVAKALANSLYAVHIEKAGQVVGMGRIIGDGGLNFDLVDIAVDPAHQGVGLGRFVTATLMDYLMCEAEHGAYITLMADVPALYEKFGFRHSSPATEGMYYDWNNHDGVFNKTSSG